MIWQGRTVETARQLLSEMSAIFDLPDEWERRRQAAAFTDAYLAENPANGEANIGYLCGYQEPERMRAMLELFAVSHPIFGPPIAGELVSPKGAFALGQLLGEELSPEHQN